MYQGMKQVIIIFVWYGGGVKDVIFIVISVEPLDEKVNFFLNAAII